MSDLLKKIKDKYNKIRKGHTSYTKAGIRPTHDWAVMLIATSLTVCLLIILAICFYVLVDQGKLFVVTVDDSQKEVKINTTLLDKVVGDINTREANLLKANQNQLSQPDPLL